MLLINNSSRLVVAVLNYAVDEKYLEEGDLLLIDQDGQVGDAYTDKLLPRPSQFWEFNKASSTFVFNRERWSEVEHKVLDTVVRNLNMQFFPDADKCALVQLAASDLRKQIDSAHEELYVDYEKEILSVAR